MNKKAVLKKTEHFVKRKLEGEGTGHDWWHILRVRNTALTIGKEEKTDLFVVELAALLHDIADHKFNKGDSTIGPKLAKKYLRSLGVHDETIEHVGNIIANMSFHKSLDGETGFTSKELNVVQDADRLDAMGAIGIARAFAYGGHKGRELYNPNFKPKKYKDSEDYKKHPASSTVMHFYEKLFTLKNLMNTKSAKKLAQEREKFMKIYLKNFFAEWQGKK